MKLTQKDKDFLEKLKTLWVWVSVGVLATAMWLAGCSAGPKADLQAEAQRAEYNQQIVLCTQAIRAGDVQQAKIHLADAKARATDYQQQRQVRSLGKLLAGAQAMLAGDGITATGEWSQIEDPHLSREVRVKAQLVGMDVPMMPTQTQEIDQ